jgi:D-sedoheptulose 7-phosphate isomerase
MTQTANDPIFSGAAEYRAALIKALGTLPLEGVVALAGLIDLARRQGRTIFVMGNGGSAMTASHLACDLNKGVSYGRERRFRVHCLNDSLSTMMAYANDLEYAAIFEEQLKNFFRPGDLVVGISGSGNSENVVRALAYARDHDGQTAALVGYGGGRMKQIAGCSVHLAVDDMQIVEDGHMMICHLLMRLFCTVPELTDQA